MMKAELWHMRLERANMSKGILDIDRAVADMLLGIKMCQAAAGIVDRVLSQYIDYGHHILLDIGEPGVVHAMCALQERGFWPRLETNVTSDGPYEGHWWRLSF